MTEAQLARSKTFYQNIPNLLTSIDTIVRGKHLYSDAAWKGIFPLQNYLSSMELNQKLLLEMVVSKTESLLISYNSSCPLTSLCLFCFLISFACFFDDISYHFLVVIFSRLALNWFYWSRLARMKNLGIWIMQRLLIVSALFLSSSKSNRGLNNSLHRNLLKPLKFLEFSCIRWL